MENYEANYGRRRGRPRKDPSLETGSGARACHDCGKPTSDYRCRACLEAWRRKHGVVVRPRER